MNKNRTQLPIGTLLQNGKYKIIRVLGQGGFGITYEVEQTMMNVRFAVKEFFVNTNSAYCRRDTNYSNIVTPNFDKQLYRKLRLNFLDEARTLHKLDHINNVVKVRDTFEENETVYFVMDFVEGMSLGQMVKKQNILSEYKVKNYAIQILEALKQVHQQSILHRDIKPDNILIRPDDTSVLIDFGIARSYIEDKTQIHTAFVSTGFAPPEQEVASARKGSYSDLYSVGATMYYCLTGNRPQTVSELSLENYRDVKFYNPKISDEINEIVNKAISKKREDRFQSCEEFLSALGERKTVITPDTSDGFSPNELKFLEYYNAKKWQEAYNLRHYINNPKIQKHKEQIISIFDKTNDDEIKEETVFSTSHRIRGIDFFIRNIIFLIPLVILIIIFAVLEQKYKGSGSGNISLKILIICFVFAIISTVVMFLTSIKRLKDNENSPWLSLLHLIPYAGQFFFIFLCSSIGKPGKNKYGRNIYREGASAKKINYQHLKYSFIVFGICLLLIGALDLYTPNNDNLQTKPVRERYEVDSVEVLLEGAEDVVTPLVEEGVAEVVSDAADESSRDKVAY